MTKKTLHLVIPGLLDPWPASAAQASTPPQAPALERLLSRATASSLNVVGADATLFQLFGLPASNEGLPVAPVTRLADGGEPPGEGWWLRADPVHLRADLRQVVLFDARHLAISLVEAQTLVAEFNKTFAEEGLNLQALHPSRWYLRLASDPGLRTCPLIEAIGRDINPLLPTGAASRRWHALLTEIQMLFHHSEVNGERERRGLPTINSVWFWGGGKLPQGIKNPVDGIYANDPVSRGLARLANVPVSPLPNTVTDWQLASQGEGESLVVLETTYFDQVDNQFDRWVKHINALESHWFSACLAMLDHKTLDHLYLYLGNGRLYEITLKHLRRFWRRTQPLLHFCQAP